MKASEYVDVLRGASLAVWAAQRGHSRVVISNKALQEWIGKQKVYRTRIEKLAKTLRPIFYKHKAVPDANTKGYVLTLYLKQKNPKFLQQINDLSQIDFIRNNLTL
jgi:hypothetical protein